MNVKKELDEGFDVSIPIIIESNRFEFEPGLKELKRKKLSPQDEKQKDWHFSEDKNERIKGHGGDICPYTGKQIGENGDRDHIIPRSSKHGILNDEANLIWASHKGNREVKKDLEFPLQELHKNYKKSQFRNCSDDEIKKWIVKTIGDGENGIFKFGPYRSFINLNYDEQKAFRHALFLVGEPIRVSVIRAIENRSRAFVNGTQRYFAQTIADNIYKKARGIDKENMISFDFISVESQESTKGDGVRDLRLEYEKTHKGIEKYSKNKGEKQASYSHLLDAHFAFAIAVNSHKNEGSLKIDTKGVEVWPLNGRTGEIHENNIFDATKVVINDMDECPLKRRKPSEDFSSHRSFTRDTFYSNRYLPILLKSQEEGISVKIGFSLSNSVELKQDKKGLLLKNIVQTLPFCHGSEELSCNKAFSSFDDLFVELGNSEYFRKQLSKNGYCCLAINRAKLHEHWMKSFNTTTGKTLENDFVYKKLCYWTEKKELKEEKEKNVFQDVLDNSKNFEIKVDGEIVCLPVKMRWLKCNKDWLEQKRKGESFDNFLRKNFQSSVEKHSHQKARKVFSLPVLTGQAKMLLKRKSWYGDHTFQVVNDSDSRNLGNKPNVPIRRQDGTIECKLARWAVSKNIVKFSGKYQKNGKAINPEHWYLIDKTKVDYPKGIEKIWYQIEDRTAPKISIELGQDGREINRDLMDEQICRHGFRNPNACDDFFDTKIKSAKRGDLVEYKGAPFNSSMKKAFETAKNDDSR